jgi:hypothetical protein
MTMTRMSAGDGLPVGFPFSLATERARSRTAATA